MQATAVRFAEVARQLGDAARSGGLVVPTFRSPPSGVGVRRSLRRRADDSVSISVALRDRPWPAVVADMIDGIIATNRLDGVPAGEWRDRLWATVEARVPLPVLSEAA